MRTRTVDGRIADIWGARTPFAPGEEWTVRVDTLLEPDVDEKQVSWVPSACVLCSNGCGLDIAVHDGRIVGVRGRAGDRVNRGRLGPKGLHGWRANNAPDRLTTPLVRRGGALEPAAWEEAMELVVGAVAARARRAWPTRYGLLQLRPVVPRGLLHPRSDGAGRYRYSASGRQHAPVHRDGGCRPEGEFRLGWRSRVADGHRPLRHASPRRAQRGRDADCPVGAHS